MNLRAVPPSARRVASPHHSMTHLGGDPAGDPAGDRAEILALILRLAAAGLLGAVGWIHLHLWQAGYRHIPTIGPLFLAGAITAMVVGVALLGRPSRLIALLGFGTVAGILGGLIVSVNGGLFGFRESLSAQFAVESILFEIAAATTLVAWTAADLMNESRRTASGARPADAPAPTTVRVRTLD